MTAYAPPDRELPNQEAVDLVIALQRCLTSFHARADEPAILTAADDRRLDMLGRYLEARRLRSMVFGQGLFSDPGWDVLLTLFQAELEDRPVTLDQISETLRLSMTIAMRHVELLERRGLLLGTAGSPGGGRRRLRLAPLAVDAMTSWLYLAFGERKGASAHA